MGRIRQLFSHPGVGISGSISSVIGVGLAIYFYIAAQGNRELIYTVHPVQSVIADAREPGALSVLLGGVELSDVDVVVMRLALWNAGSLPIRAEHVLETVRVRLGEDARVLRVRVSEVSRSVTDFGYRSDSLAFAAGDVPLEWLILEEGDGGVVEITYAGPRDRVVEIDGTIEGQGAPSVLVSRAQILSPSEQYEEFKSSQLSEVWVGATMLVVVVLLIIGTGLLEAKMGKESAKFAERMADANLTVSGPSDSLPRAIKIMNVVLLVVVVWVLANSIWEWRTSAMQPPFGF